MADAGEKPIVKPNENDDTETKDNTIDKTRLIMHIMSCKTAKAMFTKLSSLF